MSKELAKTYDPKGLEDRLYQKWLDKGYFHATVNPNKKPFTIMMPPPNVTGQLHIAMHSTTPCRIFSAVSNGWRDMKSSGSREPTMRRLQPR